MRHKTLNLDCTGTIFSINVDDCNTKLRAEKSVSMYPDHNGNLVVYVNGEKIINIPLNEVRE